MDDPILSESSLLAFKTQRPKRLGEYSFSHHWVCSGNAYFPTSGGEQIGSGGKSPILASVSPQHQARPSGWFCPMYVRGRDPPQSPPRLRAPQILSLTYVVVLGPMTLGATSPLCATEGGRTYISLTPSNCMKLNPLCLPRTLVQSREEKETWLRVATEILELIYCHSVTKTISTNTAIIY